ncbi:MAG: hypothetical protein A2Z88_03655 [Omnitrophica WOR_2 bacterium GWA2_47_8]|nr:MAG: hypothetical protein A2Z88_03655 [Omnitrophica WOR_2 bacterium GWA2_47_8]
MPRFFLKEKKFDQPAVTITDPKEIHHLKNVLRLKKEEKITLFNAHGEEANATILSISEQKVEVAINSMNKSPANPFKLTLACAIPKKAKFETIIEKATELGVDEIVPLQTKRTEVIIPKERMTSKIARFETIAVNAAKQSQRSSVPHISPGVDFKTFLRFLKAPCLILIPCLPEPRLKLSEALAQTKDKNFTQIICLIGPEGDFTPEEIEFAKEEGAIPVSLGKTTLKVDTACFCILSYIKITLNI